MAVLRALLMALLLLFPAVAAHAQSVTRYTNSTDSASNGINENATPCSSPFTRTFSVTDSFSVSEVEVGVLMAHTYRSDLVINLVSPAGTRVQLMTDIGGAADNLNILFDKDASAAISTHTANDIATATTVVPPYSRSFTPASALSAFNGQSANGTWTLEICDQYNSDRGTFYQADLYLTRPVGNYADLSLTTSISATAPATGALVTYTLTVTNAAASTDSASGIVVTDLLPSGLQFSSASGTGSYNSSNGQWSVGTLAPGQSATMAITAQVTANSGTSVVNIAEITASSIADSDSTPNNGVAGEDDRTSTSFTATSSRSAGVAPAFSCSAGTLLFDWDGRSWSAGSTANTYSLSGIGNVAFSISNPGVFLNNAALGGQSPALQSTVTGGLSPAQSSLVEFVDLASQAQAVTTQIDLGTAVPGARFSLFDVDYGASQFADKVTVTGYLNGTAVTPVLTNGVANYVIGSSAYGDVTSADASSDGNVVVTFNSAIDRIVISYGNHSLAPANPGQQAITIHDLTLCKPVAAISATKVSSVISDPLNGTTNPKAIPGAVMQYCIVISNAGPASATNLAASDALPANFTFTTGTIRSGSNCGSAATVEDENNTGADETDPVGVSLSSGTITTTTGSLASGSAIAVTFQGTVN